MEIAYDGVNPDLDPSAFIAPGVVLIGKVRIGAGSSVWFQSVLRADNDWIEIGERTNIQDGCILHVDPGLPIHIGSECVIGHGAILHGCTLGDHVLVGMGAKILNQVTIPEDVIVAAGALVPERMTLESGFLYAGIPARQVRPLRAEELQRIRHGAKGYEEKAAAYRLLLRG